MCAARCSSAHARRQPGSRAAAYPFRSHRAQGVPILLLEGSHSATIEEMIVPDVTRTAFEYADGERVRVRYRKRGEWSFGTISADNRAGTYDVRYDDPRKNDA